ncbi:MAG TPA: type II toxin-antitoxin system VapC family toxin [Gemmataceae bacterium]|nr:type II toxin-antitoxin system VapC family toxin [Gemmataceae bacterium]
MTVPFHCVVDASVAVKLYLAEPLATEAAALFGLLADPANVFHVPDLFYVECANIFWKYVQRRLATDTQVTGYLKFLKALPLLHTSTFDLTGDALTLGVAHGITAYDACYVALAQRLAVSLITADQKLDQKLRSAGLSVTWLGIWKPPASTP